MGIYDVTLQTRMVVRAPSKRDALEVALDLIHVQGVELFSMKEIQDATELPPHWTEDCIPFSSIKNYDSVPIKWFLENKHREKCI
jgi:hypothetical protein